MKTRLTIFALAIVMVMIVVTIWASMQQNILSAFAPLAHNPWAVATLFDAYCGFLIFYVWVASRERTAARRILWFMAIMALGNIATGAYLLLQLRKLSARGSLRELLLPS